MGYSLPEIALHCLLLGLLLKALKILAAAAAFHLQSSACFSASQLFHLHNDVSYGFCDGGSWSQLYLK